MAHEMRMRHTVMWPFRIYNIFKHYLKKKSQFSKKFIEHEYVFRISLQLLSTKFPILRNNERDNTIKNVYWSSCKVPAGLVF